MTKGRVLVTGANGFIAARVVEAFLQAGFSVRGTVRSKSTTGDIETALAKYGSEFEVVEVPDITAQGAFDQVIKGIDAIAHLASPVSLSFTDPEPILKAAIHGTTRVLESAMKEPSVRSVVLMSSVTAVKTPKTGPYTFTDKDWNDWAEKMVALKGKETPGGVIYSASKAAAEKAFWKFRDEHKPAFSMTALNPSFVIGPPLIPRKPRDLQDGTYSVVYWVLAGESLDKINWGDKPSYVDVRDVARLVVFSTEHPQKSDGQRFILSVGCAPTQAFADVLREAFPERRDIIQEGKKGEGYSPGFAFAENAVYDCSKAVEFTGQPLIPFEKAVVDTAKAFMPLL